MEVILSPHNALMKTLTCYYVPEAFDMSPGIESLILFLIICDIESISTMKKTFFHAYLCNG